MMFGHRANADNQAREHLIATRSTIQRWLQTRGSVSIVVFGDRPHNMSRPKVVPLAPRLYRSTCLNMHPLELNLCIPLAGQRSYATGLQRDALMNASTNLGCMRSISKLCVFKYFLIFAAFPFSACPAACVVKAETHKPSA